MSFCCGEAEEDHGYVTSRVGRDGVFHLFLVSTTAIRLRKMTEGKEEAVLWMWLSGTGDDIKRPEAGWGLRASAGASASAAPTRPLTSRMASSVKTFLACSLLAFVSVHAAQRSHPRDSSIRDAAAAAAAPVVTVKNGSYEGVYSPEYNQDFFLGMRYAEVCIAHH